MDSRPPPSSFSRPPDSAAHESGSSSIHTPAQSSSASHAPYFPSAGSKQLPLQVPFASETYQRRGPDPFLPNPQSHQRRNSYGLNNGRDAAHMSRDSGGAIWSSASGPNNSQSSHVSHSAAPPPPPTFAYNQERNPPLGAQSPPKYYGSTAQEPPSSNFGSRQMPPPSPSQQAPPLSNYASRPPPFTMGRELPALGSTNRPGSGMSISSILGTDTPSQPPAPSTSTHSPTVSSMHPPSPRRSQIPGSRVEPPSWRRPETPDKYPSSMRPAEPTSYAPVSSPRYLPASSRDSPEYSRGAPPALYQSHPTPPRASHVAQASSPEKSSVRQLDDRYPARPNSQPSNYALPRRDQEYRDQSTSGPRQELYSNSNMERGGSQEDPRSHGYSSQSSSHVATNDRSPSAPSAPGSLYAPASRIAEDNNLLRRNMMGQESHREEPRHEYGAPRKEEYSSPLKTGFRGSYYSQPPTASTIEAPRSHPQIIEALRRPPEQFASQEPIPIHSRSLFETDRRRDDTLMRRSESRDSRRMGGEDMQQSRSFLGINSDPNKRGRASPLPQAVKGAQAQLLGPGSDPSIKSEFGRIFQGLGSSLGGPGSLTPSRQSPVPQRIRDEAGHHSDNDTVKMTRVGSQGGRGLGRRPREDGRPDGEDGRSTPLSGLASRAPKRPRVLHNNQLISLQQDLDDVAIIQDRTNNIVPIQPNTSLLLPTPTLPKPSLSISSKQVLDAVSHIARKHYGSCVYEQHNTLPPKADAGPEDTFPQFLLPRRFTDDEIGGTFTVRVPRWYLTPATRRDLIRDPYLFGTDVYTDDSNPLAAAMHAGWIRGAWPADLDTSLMDLPPESDLLAAKDLKDRDFGSSGANDIGTVNGNAENGDEDVGSGDGDEDGVLKLPAVPLTPPPLLDAHITLLILPTLQRYARTLRFGVKSKEWARETHDGLSFMVVGLRFVDEGSRVGQARTGKARRQRIRRELDMRDKRWQNRVDALQPVKAS